MSIKHGIICPVNYLEKFAVLSDFHLILPHLYDKYPAYKEFYRSRVKQGDFVLQDNSVFELEESLPGEALMEMAEDLGVSEMSAPEVLRDAKSSKKVLEEFLSRRVSLGSKTPVLAVAQGASIDELISYVYYLNSLAEVSTIGIPFDLEHLNSGDFTLSLKSLTLRRVLSRWILMERIHVEAGWVAKKLKPIHLMGLADAVELQYYAGFVHRLEPGQVPPLQVRSNDSSSAFVHGAANILYTERGLPCEKISQKLDFGLPSGTLSEAAERSVYDNIKMIQSFCE